MSEIKRKLILVEKRNKSQYVLVRIVSFKDKYVLLHGRKIGYTIDLEKPIYQKGLVYYYASDYITGNQIVFKETSVDVAEPELMNPNAIYEMFDARIVDKVVRNADKSQKQSAIVMIIVGAIFFAMGSLLTYSIMTQNLLNNQDVIVPL